MSYIVKMFNRDPSPVWEEKASRQIDTATTIDPNVAETYLARATLAWTLRNGFPHERVIREIRIAIALKPSLAEAHELLGTVYLHVGLNEESRAEFGNALRLDPLNASTRNRTAVIGMFIHDYAGVVEEFERNPRLPADMQWIRAVALLSLGRESEAAQLVRDRLKDDPRSADYAGVQAMILARQGNRAGAEEFIARAVAMGGATSQFHHARYSIACAYAMLGQKEMTVQWLREVADDGMPSYSLFAGDPFLQPLRGYPPFDSLLAELKRRTDAFRQLSEQAIPR